MEIRALDWTPGPSIEWRTAMEEYIGLDVSMKETSVSIRRAGERIWRGKCASDPRIVAELIRKRTPAVKRVVFETGPLSIWFYHSLRAEGLPAICIDSRHAKAALDMAANKTDANDADGLAQLAEVGFFREVRVKGFDSMLTRTLVAARTRLVHITTELSNQIRGVMKTFGLLVPAGKGSTFEKNVRSLLAKLIIEECETGYDTKKGVECYDSIRGKNPVVITPLSTGVTLQVIPKASVDKLPVFTMAYGLSASADGNLFPWIFN